MNRKKAVLLFLVRLLVGGVLVYSGYSKVVGPSAEFAGVIAAYRILPIHWTQPLAVLWPWLELLVGTYVIFGYLTRVFALVASVMFAGFIVILGSAILRGIDPGSCGCFGAMLSFSTRQAITLDIVLLTLSGWITFSAKTPLFLSVDAWMDRS